MSVFSGRLVPYSTGPTNARVTGVVEGTLANPSRRTAKETAAMKTRIVKTVGEILPDGSVIELVASASHDRLELLLWNGHKKIVAPQIEYLGHVYQAPDLHETMRRAIRFPKNA